MSEAPTLFTVGVFVAVRDTLLGWQSKTKILLVKHAYKDRKWSLPGGALQHPELLWECALRESKEETGLRVIVEKLLAVRTGVKNSNLVFLFEGCCPVPPPAKISPPNPQEIEKARFFLPRNIPYDDMYPAQQVLLRDALRPTATDSRYSLAQFPPAVAVGNLSPLSIAELEKLQIIQRG
ncbi:MAG: NUDIX hydrolase [Parcubacteria group bacterium]|nr:NUDIX hydrolase [Parcubacteria group bacterium]